MAVDLEFKSSPLTDPPIDLVFGEIDPPPGVDTSISIVGTLPGITSHLKLRQVRRVFVGGALPGVSGHGAMIYTSRTSGRFSSEVQSRFQDGIAGQANVTSKYQKAAVANVPTRARWQNADPLLANVTQRWQDGDKVNNAMSVRWQDALRLETELLRVRYQQGNKVRLNTDVVFQVASLIEAQQTRVRFQQGSKRRNWTAEHFQDAIRQSSIVRENEGYGKPIQFQIGGRYQNAIRPPPGVRVPPVIPGPDPCYIPPPGDQVPLLFAAAAALDANLLFWCETHEEPPDGETIVIPVKRVYVIINEANLRRADDDTLIRNVQMNFALDVDSYTFTFSASLPVSELDKIMPDMSGAPVEVKAMINGEQVNGIVERVSKQRTHKEEYISIQGRGVNALLDAPYSPIMNFGNTELRTAEQLLGDILSINTVPLPDWMVNFTLTDWEIPGGIWTHQGTHITALNQVIQAAGGYLQPHPFLKQMYALPRYPFMPRDWDASVTPDFVIPADVATVEGMEWVDKAKYNRVFVSGVNGGVFGEWTLTGSDGLLVAPMVTDSLITHVDASRQRAIRALADVGRQRLITLRMPVFEASGLILPGKFVNYTEGAESRLGLARSMSVETNYPEIMQSVILETHINP